MTSPDGVGDDLSLTASGLKIDRQWSARLLSTFFAVLFGALFANPAFAGGTCKPGNVSKVLDAGTIVIPMNAPSGTVVSTLPPSSFQMQCAFLNSAPFVTTVTATIQLTVTAALAPGFADVYKTSVDGLGIRYVFDARRVMPAICH
jgi:hypothetical protein